MWKVPFEALECMPEWEYYGSELPATILTTYDIALLLSSGSSYYNLCSTVIPQWIPLPDAVEKNLHSNDLLQKVLLQLKNKSMMTKIEFHLPSRCCCSEMGCYY